MRKTICRSSRLTLVVAGAVLAPATATAQVDTTAARADSTWRAVHVVERGDTLWDLAIQYLSNAYRWPEIFRSNRDVVENPNRIYPGERLRIPGAPADAVARAPGRGDETPASVGVISVTGQGAARPVGAPADSVVIDRGGDELARAARRLADFVAAPYVAERGGPSGAGRVLATGTALGSPETRMIMLGDPVRLTLPAGTAPEVGARYLVFALGDEVGSGQVVRPTGIVQVTEYQGSDVRGRMVAVLGLVEDGQRLTTLPAPPAADAAVSAAGAARVAWVENRSVLPALQDWLLLTPAGGAVVGEGDVVELLGPAPDDATVEPQVLGTARVVRVTTHGASAMITSVRESGIEIGTRARILAGAR